MGKGGDFVKRVAEENIRIMLKGAISRTQTRIPRPDTLGKLSADGQYIQLPDGTYLNAVVDGTPGQIGAVIVVNDQTAYMPDQVPKAIHIAGSKSAWFVIGVYADFGFGSFATDFPVFNLVNAVTLQQYVIPQSLCPDVYATDIATHTTIENGVSSSTFSDFGYNGQFFVRLSDNGKDLVIVRIRAMESTIENTDDGGPYPESVSVGFDATGETEQSVVDSIRVYYGIIKNFVLDIDNESVIAGVDTVVEQGTIDIPYSFPPLDLADTVVPVGMPLSGSWSSGGRTITTTFDGWGIRPEYKYQMSLDPVVWTDADGDTKLDLVGSWYAIGISTAAYAYTDTFPHSGSIRGANVSGAGLSPTFTAYGGVVSNGGLFSIRDVSGTAINVDVDYSTGDGSIVRYDGTAPTVQLFGLASQTNASTFGFKYRDTAGSARSAYRIYGHYLVSIDSVYTSSFLSTLDELAASKHYYLSPYDTIETISEFVDAEDTNFIGDSTRMYPPATGWAALVSPLIKTYGTGLFWELEYEYPILTKIKKWRYDTEAEAMVQSGEVKFKTYEDPLEVFKEDGSPLPSSHFTFAVMDFMAK